MKYLVFLVFYLLNVIDSYSQKQDISTTGLFYHISPVPGFRESAVTFTFDDGYLSQFRIGLPLLREYNLPATFYLITNLLDSLTQKIILDNITTNYELGSHTLSHVDLVNASYETVDQELSYSKKKIQSDFGNENGLTLSYPWGLYNHGVIKLTSLYYLGARSADVGFNSLQYFDRYAIKMQGFNQDTKLEDVNSWVDYAIMNHLWLVEMIHGIDGDGFSPVNSTTLRQHFEYVSNKDSLLWCSTVVNFIKYFDEAKATEIICDECSDTVYKIRINDYLDDSVYNQPLSVELMVPVNWSDISVSGINHKVLTKSGKKQFIYFDALPDDHQIVIRPASIRKLIQESGLNLVYLTANPFINDIRISMEAPGSQDVDIDLYSLSGELIIHRSIKSAKGIIDLYFETSNLGSGLYFLRIISLTDKSRFIRKMIKI